jgi:nucleoid-associated protein Lsr2
MAQKVSVLLTDDLDGTEADQTLTFSLDGADYEIDLSEGNAERLRAALAEFVEAARPVRRHVPAPTWRTPRDRERARRIRAWAVQQGVTVSDRGRVPATIVAQYEAAHPQGRG